MNVASSNRWQWYFWDDLNKAFGIWSWIWLWHIFRWHADCLATGSVRSRLLERYTRNVGTIPNATFPPTFSAKYNGTGISRCTTEIMRFRSDGSMDRKEFKFWNLNRSGLLFFHRFIIRLTIGYFFIFEQRRNSTKWSISCGTRTAICFIETGLCEIKLHVLLYFLYLFEFVVIFRRWFFDSGEETSYRNFLLAILSFSQNFIIHIKKKEQNFPRINNKTFL